MIKQYNILKAEQSKGAPDSHGNISFWIEIEGEGSALALRKPTSPILSGPTWGELEDKTSARGNSYKKFTVKPAPDSEPKSYSPRGQERIFKADPDKQASIEWQASIKAAVEAVRDFHTLKGAEPLDLKTYKLDIVNTAITFAGLVDKQPEHTITSPEEPEDDPELPPVDQLVPPDEVDQINLDDIPF